MNNLIKKGKKIFAGSVVLTTIVWSVGILGMPLGVSAAASGDLIKITCTGSNTEVCTAVYYLGANGKRYVFPNEKSYKTWYADFSTVKSISQTEMESYTIGGNVTYKPGVKMVKITTDPKVYAVAANGTLKWVKTEALATTLYGATWNKQIDDVPDAFFVNYTVGTEIAAATDYDKTAQTTNATSINADKGLSVAAGSTLTVALAADTPASGIVAGNAARAPFTKVNLTAAADGDIKIDSMVVQRTGTAARDGAFSELILLDGATQAQIDNGKTLNSSHQVTFTEDITVPAGTTKSLILAANMLSSLASYAGEVPSLSLVSVTLSGSATVVGTLPITGNYQTLNGTVTIGTATIANGSNNPSASTQKIGVTNFVLSGIKMTAGSAEALNIEQIKWNQSQTASDSDVESLELIVDSAVVATVANPSDKDVLFDLRSSPISIDKGKSKQIDIRGDIVDGSARTIRFDIKKNTDIVVKGVTYGYYITPSYTNTTEPYWNSAGITTIARGTIKVTPTGGVANANVAEDSKQVVLGKFDFEAKGEDVSVSRLGMQVKVDQLADGSASTTDITNVSLYDENGVIIAGPLDPTEKYYESGEIFYGTATTTDTFTVAVGTHTYTIKGDLSADFAAGDTIRMQITPYPNITAKGVTTGESLASTDITPATVQTSATYTVKTAALAISVSTLPVAQTVVAGTKDFVFANYLLDAADSGEDVKITQVIAKMTTSTALPNDFSNWKLYDGTTELAVSTDPDPTGTTAGAASSTFTLVTPLIVTKGTTKTLTVKATISASATSGSLYVGMTAPTQITATGKDSGTDATVTLSAANGQTMTLAQTGTLQITKASTSPDAGLLPSETTGITVGAFRLAASYEDVNVEKIYLSATSTRNRDASLVDTAYDQMNTVYLYNGSTLMATVNPTTTESGAQRTVLIDVTNTPIVVPKDGVIDLTVKVDTAGVRRDISAKGFPGQGFIFSINAAGDITAKGKQSGATVSSVTATGATFNAMTVWKSVPTLTLNDQMSSGIASGSGKLTGNLSVADVYKFQVTADSKGDIGLYSVSFLVSTTSATVTKLYLHDGSNYVSATTVAAIIMSDAAASDETVFRMQFTSDGLAPGATNGTPYTVSAGTTKSFTLKVDVTCGTAGQDCTGTSGNGSIKFQFLGDNGFPGTYPDSASSLQSDIWLNSFIWTDFSTAGPLGTSSSTVTSSEEWTNGYRVTTASGKLSPTSTAVSWSK